MPISASTVAPFTTLSGPVTLPFSSSSSTRTKSDAIAAYRDSLIFNYQRAADNGGAARQQIRRGRGASCEHVERATARHDSAAGDAPRHDLSAAARDRSIDAGAAEADLLAAALEDRRRAVKSA